MPLALDLPPHLFFPAVPKMTQFAVSLCRCITTDTRVFPNLPCTTTSNGVAQAASRQSCAQKKHHFEVVTRNLVDPMSSLANRQTLVAGNFLMLAVTLTLLAGGCVVPNPPVPTYWQKLGIPQAHLGLRDHLVNRKGFFPEKERKPPRLRIADPKNLESPNPLLKNAAEIKADQDLAPQKIKALKFLATVACGCEPTKVEEAILKGLTDCSAEVRAEAIKTVLATAGMPVCDPEDPRNKKKCRIIGACKKCKTKGCESCGYSGFAECGEESCGCQPCGACCTEAIQKQLKKMAEHQLDNGCWFEPVAENRELAAQAMIACPPIPEKKPVKDPIIKPETPTPAGEGDEGDDSDSDEAKEEGDEAKQENGSGASNSGSVGDQAWFNSNRTSRLPAQLASVVPGRSSSNLVAGIVSQSDLANGQLTIKLDRPYQLPMGALLLVEGVNGLQVEMHVTETQPGVIVARSLEPLASQADFGHRATVRVGVIGN